MFGALGIEVLGALVIEVLGAQEAEAFRVLEVVDVTGEGSGVCLKHSRQGFGVSEVLEEVSRVPEVHN